MTEPLLTARETAAYLKVCKETVMRWARAGKLPSVQLGTTRKRFREKDVAAFVTASAKVVKGGQVTAFAHAACEFEPGAIVSKSRMYSAYRQWAESEGVRPILDQRTFGRNLFAANPALMEQRPRVGSKREWCYVGLRLKPSNLEL